MSILSLMFGYLPGISKKCVVHIILLTTIWTLVRHCFLTIVEIFAKTTITREHLCQIIVEFLEWSVNPSYCIRYKPSRPSTVDSLCPLLLPHSLLNSSFFDSLSYLSRLSNISSMGGTPLITPAASADIVVYPLQFLIGASVVELLRSFLFSAVCQATVA